MATNIVAAAHQPTNPTFVVEPLDAAIVEACRAEMKRIEAAADWAAQVAECAARGDE